MVIEIRRGVDFRVEEIEKKQNKICWADETPNPNPNLVLLWLAWIYALFKLPFIFYKNFCFTEIFKPMEEHGLKNIKQN